MTDYGKTRNPTDVRTAARREHWAVVRPQSVALLVLTLIAVLLTAVPVAAGDDDDATRSDRFGRMFPSLAPASEPSEQLTDAIARLGRAGGPIDAKDALERGPIDLIVDLSLSAGNPNNPTNTAGTTFLGQFVDHDLTKDAGSPLGVPTDPATIANLRTPSFDLDSVYGTGPAGSPELYEAADPVKLRVENGGLFEDLPRRDNGSAVLVEGRNDENLIISGLHAAFLKFHNRAVDVVRAQGVRPNRVFERARQLTRWHYQWVVLNEFLPQIVGQERVDQALRRRKFFRPDEPYIPVEFQAAAYRFGHSQVRPSYRANLAGDNGAPFFALLFDPAQFRQPDPDDLTGGSRAPRRFVGWQTFFDFGDGAMRPNKRIDTKISTPLFNLPVGTLPGGRGPASLVHRNLLRGLTWSLPSGQSVAARMGVRALTPSQLSELAGYGIGLERATPLWYYLLKEAEVTEDGLRLGPVGGRIVAEVFVGLLELDDSSYLNQERRWRPTLPSLQRSRFTMVDFLTFAGVDPASRGQ